MYFYNPNELCVIGRKHIAQNRKSCRPLHLSNTLVVALTLWDAVKWGDPLYGFQMLMLPYF